MESPTLLHTLNADVQGLLSERLLENTLTQLEKYPVYLLHHKIQAEAPMLNYICLGSDPVASLLSLITHLVEVCNYEYVGFVRRLLWNYCSGDEELIHLWNKHPELQRELDDILGQVGLMGSGPHSLAGSDTLFRYMLMPELGRRHLAKKHISCVEADLFLKYMDGSHELLKKHLDADDLITMLNQDGKSNSCSLLPLNQHHELKHF